MMKMDKINIYIPQDTSRMLENDAVQFEIFKKDGRTVNKNRFLTMLLQGYYEEYINTSRQTYEEICSILESGGLSDNQKSDIANEIVEKVFLPEIPVRKGKSPVC